MINITNFLENNNFNYFLLTNSDEFFSEYVPNHQKFIEKFTGFTGSNATVIFGLKKHYFFTDGRYITQAKNQLDHNKYEIIDIAKQSIYQWISDNLRDSDNFAIDSKLVSVVFVENIQKLNFNLKLIKQNPFENSDKNFLQQNPFFCNENIVGKNFTEKKLQILDNIYADALLITKPENVNWLLNIRGNDIDYNPIFLTQSLLLKNGKLIIFSDNEVLKNLKNNDIELVAKEQIINFFESFFSKNSLNTFTIQTDFSSTNHWLYEVLIKNNFSVIHKDCPINLIKAIKNSAEIYGAKQAHFYDAIAIIKFLYWLNSHENQAQINEISAEEKLYELRKKYAGFYCPSFATISAFGANGAIIHYNAKQATNKYFNYNSLYLIDSGGHYYNKNFLGTTDITRTIAIKAPSLDMIKHYTLVLKGHINIARLKFPKGTLGADIDVLARCHLWNSGLDYQHSTGHGVGSFLSVHEGPYGISKRSKTILNSGMIISNEPGLYIENQYGIRLENLMLVQEFDKNFLQFETLTLVPFELDLIDFKMITYPERKWLINYHHKILNEVILNQNNFDHHEIQWFKEHYIEPLNFL